MRIEQQKWQDFLTFVTVELKQSDKKHNVCTLRSRYKLLCVWFNKNKCEFTRSNFNLFLQDCKKNKHTNSTLNNWIKTAKLVDKWLKTEELKDYTYFKENRERDDDYLKEEEVIAIAEAKCFFNEEIEHKHKTITYFLYVTGCRISELSGLLWEDCYLDNPTPYVKFRETKSGNDHKVTISTNLIELMKKLPRRSSFVFSDKERPVDRTFISDALKKKAKSVGIDPIRVHPHAFRHSSVSNKLHQGVPIYIVKDIHNHKSIETTERYNHHGIEEMIESLRTYAPMYMDEHDFVHRQRIAAEFLTKLFQNYNVSTKNENDSFFLEVRK